jgi:hypothetical protein
MDANPREPTQEEVNGLINKQQILPGYIEDNPSKHGGF